MERGEYWIRSVSGWHNDVDRDSIYVIYIYTVFACMYSEMMKMQKQAVIC